MIFSQKNQVGTLVNSFDETAYARAWAQIPDLLKLDRRAIREVAKRHFSLEKAVEAYGHIYPSFE